MTRVRWVALVGAVVLGLAALFFVRQRDEDPDIILVTIDTLRADGLGISGQNKVRTPFLDELAEGGIYFENAHAHNVMTLPSHTNILTGLLPYQHGVRDNAGFSLVNRPHVAKASRKQPTIAATLAARGYATGAFVAAYPLDSHFGLDQGFEVYDDEYPKSSITGFGTPERPASAVLAAAETWYAAAGDRKKFLWVHLYEPHHPYEPPSPFREEYRDAPYYGEIAAVDDALGRFLRPILEQRPGTLVILTSDHGEGLGDHDENYHGLFAYESTLKVPLILYERERLQPRREKNFVAHTDIVPTILDRLGLQQPEELKGASLLGVQAPRDTYFEALWGTLNFGWAPLVGMIHDGHKYIDLPVAELYDLPSDPAEEKNILESNRRMTTRIREKLVAAAPGPTAVQRNVTPDEAKNLLSLGYLTGTAAAKTSYSADDDPKNLVQYHGQMNAALELHRQGASAEAVRIAESLLRERPEMTMASDLLAHILEQSGDRQEAEGVLRAALANGTASDAMKKRLGLLLSEKGEAREAVAILAPFAGSSEPPLLNAYGIALADVGRMREAVQQFERVLELDPDNASAYENLGVLALQMNDLARAERFLSRALELNARMPRALNTMGVIHARNNDLPRAMEAWQRSVELDPRQYDALFNLGMVAGRAGRPEDARRALTLFVKTAPPDRYARDIAAAKQALAALKGIEN